MRQPAEVWSTRHLARSEFSPDGFGVSYNRRRAARARELAGQTSLVEHRCNDLRLAFQYDAVADLKASRLLVGRSKSSRLARDLGYGNRWLVNAPGYIRPSDTVDLDARIEWFTGSVRQVASRGYDVVQINAWAPVAVDRQHWRTRIDGGPTYVAEMAGEIVGFSDLQPDGHIDISSSTPIIKA